MKTSSSAISSLGNSHVSISFPQNEFSTSVNKEILNLKIENDDVIIFNLCQLMAPSFERAINPFYIFQNVNFLEAKDLIHSQALVFQAKRYQLPKLVMFIHYRVIKHDQFVQLMEGFPGSVSDDQFLLQAISALLNLQNGVEAAEGETKTHYELFLSK
jgi:hypothetical protein